MKKILVTSIVLFVITSISMAVIDIYIQNTVTPYGIISFEFIKTIENSNAAMSAWGSIGKTAAGISLGLDYLYILLYTIIGSIFLIITSEKILDIKPSLGMIIRNTAYLFPMVSIFDLIENFSLIQLLLGSQSEIWPITAYYFAFAKFLGVGIALLLIIMGQAYAKIKTA